MDEYTVNDVIDSAISGDVADLERAFGAVMKQKINQAMETRKQTLGLGLGETEEDE